MKASKKKKTRLAKRTRSGRNTPTRNLPKKNRKSIAKSPQTVGLAEDVYGDDAFTDSELVIGLVGAVGTELDRVVDHLEKRLSAARYDVKIVQVSRHIIPLVTTLPRNVNSDEFSRIWSYMDAGNAARLRTGNNAILALGAASEIGSRRRKSDKGVQEPYSRHAYIIKSLKHPAEVIQLRRLYPQAFYLLGAYSDEARRKEYLVESGRMSEKQAEKLIRRDEREGLDYGQGFGDTFHMSDFFVQLGANDDRVRFGIWRLIDILFGCPFATPTIDEYAMFLAFAASLRSADLSRQVGAVIVKEGEVVATGVNDVPKFGGGLYTAEMNSKSGRVEDQPKGRDYLRDIDPNVSEQEKIIEEIVRLCEEQGLDKAKAAAALNASRIKSLTEFGRSVHAEMQAILCCARNGVSPKDATLFSTTFPCHNCAKHIVAAGIKRVVYIEPYPKSLATQLHDDSIKHGFSGGEKQADRVYFEPFVGIGPRRFFDLFSTSLGAGRRIVRKDSNGRPVKWDLGRANLRRQMLPTSYLDLEWLASKIFEESCEREELQGGKVGK